MKHISIIDWDEKFNWFLYAKLWLCMPTIRTQNDLKLFCSSSKSWLARLIFLGSTSSTKCFTCKLPNLYNSKIESKSSLFNHDQIHCIFNVLAGLRYVLVDNLKNKQPVSTIHVWCGIARSQQLQKQAANAYQLSLALYLPSSTTIGWRKPSTT